MKRSLKHALGATALAAGFLLLGGQAALADDGITSDIDTVVGSGNVSPSVQASVCGNSVAVLDADARADCDGTESSTSNGSTSRQAGGADAGTTSDIDTVVASGNVSPKVQATVCGNSVAVLDATADAECGGDQSTTSNGRARSNERASAGTSDIDAVVGSGNVSPVLGVTVCGNSAAVADASSGAGCHGDATTGSDGDVRDDRRGASGGDGPDAAGTDDVVGDIENGVDDEGAAIARETTGRPLDEVLGRHIGRHIAAVGAGVAAFAHRAATDPLPGTGASLRRHFAWATLFLLSGAGLLARDALMR